MQDSEIAGKYNRLFVALFGHCFPRLLIPHAVFAASTKSFSQFNGPPSAEFIEMVRTNVTIAAGIAALRTVTYL